ncbi:hypothetical protein H4219_005589 [Mycoemilia scoparia]|uniref:Coiled-coil domain-containing protein 47 n=1 Tax=Mycoemilia scoparia TaxID=417184 RepID=A0A9W7ZVH5_9FUNG|nr:hypothetical protein H4219_005589 [Mycoemilia scoparia]
MLLMMMMMAVDEGLVKKSLLKTIIFIASSATFVLMASSGMLIPVNGEELEAANPPPPSDASAQAAVSSSDGGGSAQGQGDEITNNNNNNDDDDDDGIGNRVYLGPPLTLSDFKIEIGLLILLTIYIANYVYGFKTNDKEAEKWVQPIEKVLKKHFYTVGPPSGKSVLEYDGPSDRLFWASGRRNCQFIQGHLQLKPRQDLVGLLSEALANQGERLLVDIVLSKENDGSGGGRIEDFIFAITPKKRATTIRRERYDINQFTRQESIQTNSTNKISAKLAIHSEHGEITQLMLKAPGIEKIASGRNPILEELIISDQPISEPKNLEETKVPEKHLFAIFKLPNHKKGSGGVEGRLQVQEALDILINMVDYLVDSVKLSSATKKKLEKARSEAYKGLAKKGELERQDQLAKIKADKKKAEQDRLAKLPAAERRKIEEKQRKREAKKSMSKRTKLVK